VRGIIGVVAREFLVGVWEGAHSKRQLRAGEIVSGKALPVRDQGNDRGACGLSNRVTGRENEADAGHRCLQRHFGEHSECSARDAPGSRGPCNLPSCDLPDHLVHLAFQSPTAFVIAVMMDVQKGSEGPNSSLHFQYCTGPLICAWQFVSVNWNPG
jgi:hypothetical protein